MLHIMQDARLSGGTVATSSATKAKKIRLRVMLEQASNASGNELYSNHPVVAGLASANAICRDILGIAIHVTQAIY